jgi:hypothetical protein
VAGSTDIYISQIKRTDQSLFNSQVSKVRNNEAIDMLVEEGGESFFNYVDWLGLAKDPDLIVLSSLHHYYYDPEEMNNFQTVINLKELNQIKDVKNFLRSSLQILPPNSNFIGCFIDNEKTNGYEVINGSSYVNKRNRDAIDNGIISRIPFINMLYSILDSKTIRYMSKHSISLLLEDCGFKVMNMTDINGLTFFHSQKLKPAFN